MTNEQLYFAIGIPVVFNAVITLALWANLRSTLMQRIDSLLDSMNNRFEGTTIRFNGLDTRFDDMRDLWRAELRRVEEVIDARLKHLESK